MPYYQDDQSDDVPCVSNGDSPCWSQIQVGDHPNEEIVQDSKSRGNASERVDLRWRVALETLKPEEEPATDDVQRCIPEGNVQEKKRPRPLVGEDFPDGRQAQSIRSVVASMREAFDREVNIAPLEHQSIRSIRSPRQYEEANDTDGDGDYGAYDEQPTPSCQPAHPV